MAEELNFISIALIMHARANDFNHDGPSCTSSDLWRDFRRKNLVGKIAGNDPAGQYKDWNAEGLVGWSDGMSPENLVRAWIGMLDAAAVARSTVTFQQILPAIQSQSLRHA